MTWLCWNSRVRTEVDWIGIISHFPKRDELKNNRNFFFFFKSQTLFSFVTETMSIHGLIDCKKLFLVFRTGWKQFVYFDTWTLWSSVSISSPVKNSAKSNERRHRFAPKKLIGQQLYYQLMRLQICFFLFKFVNIFV